MPRRISSGLPWFRFRIERKRTLFVLFLLVAFQFLILSCFSPTERPIEASAIPSESPPPSVPLPSEKPFAPWSALRGGKKLDQGWGVDVDPAGNVYFAAFQQADGEPFDDMVIYKFAPDGKEIWQTRWGGKYMEKAFVVAVKDSIVYVGGLTYTSPVNLMEADMAVLALNAEDGNLAWDFTWGQGFGYEEVDGLVVDGDNLYLSGWTTGEKTGNDLAVLKLDLSGRLIWVNTWGGSHWDHADGQMVVDADTLYVAGRIDGGNYLLGGRALIVRFSKATGEYLSHADWGGPIGTDALGMASDGTHLYTVGLTVDRGNGGQIFLLKWDKQLRLIWEQIWGGKGSEDARAIAVGPSGDLFIAGASDSYSRGGAMDIVLLRYDPDGNLVWYKTWGGPKSDAAHGIVLFENRVYIAGNTQSSGNGQDDAILICADGSEGVFPDFPV